VIKVLINEEEVIWNMKKKMLEQWYYEEMVSQRAKVERHIVICISMVSLFRLVLTFCIWATLSTIKRCIQRTWGLIEVRSLPSRELLTSM
jgi:hypothetical protein